MQQYQVPQFITVEDKVIGPLTIKQSLYLGAGAGIIAFLWNALDSFLFWPAAAVIGGFAAALAFLKINDQPFPQIMKNAVSYLLKPKMYMWKREAPKKQAPKPAGAKPETTVKTIPKMSESKLTDLAWSLDIKARKETE